MSMPTTSQTVFVVDDDRQARQSVGALLFTMGMRAAAFASAEEFLEQYHEASSGCLVSDVRLPGMSGLDLYDRLQERQSRLPVIFISAHVSPELQTQVASREAVALLAKPYDSDELGEAIVRALQEEAACGDTLRLDRSGDE